jgi:hypothetical protein
VANGLAASCYIALPPALQDMMSFEQQHFVQHLAYTPYRLYCGALNCRDETYDEATGLSKAVMMWLPLLYVVELALRCMCPFRAVSFVILMYRMYQFWKKHRLFRQHSERFPKK